METLITTLIEKRNNLVEFSESHRNLGEKFYYILFVSMILAQYISNTMLYTLMPNDSLIYVAMDIIAFLAVIKTILFDRYNDLKELFLAISIGLIIWACCINSTVLSPLYYYAMIIGAKNVNFKNLLVIFISTLAVAIPATVLMAHFNVIPEILNSRTGSSRIRYSMGATYPTDFAARLFYLMLAYATLKKFKFNLPEYVGLVSLTFFTYVTTDTKLDVLLMLAIILVSIFNKYIFSILKVLGSFGVTFISFLGISVMVIMTYLYNPDNRFLELMNKVFTKRLEFGHISFEKYNVTLFGQNIPQIGNGGLHKGYYEYFFIDCSYVRILMMMGAISFFIFLFAILYLFMKFYKVQSMELVAALIFVLISSLIDHHLLEISFNPFLIVFMTDVGYFIRNKYSNMFRGD